MELGGVKRQKLAQTLIRRRLTNLLECLCFAEFARRTLGTSSYSESRILRCLDFPWGENTAPLGGDRAASIIPRKNGPPPTAVRPLGLN